MAQMTQSAMNKLNDQQRHEFIQNLGQQQINEIIREEEKKREQLQVQEDRTPGCLKRWCVTPVGNKLEELLVYCNVTTDHVIQRLKFAMLPHKAQFFEVGVKADLYGPFWIYLTLVFLLGAAGNLSGYLQSADYEDFTYDFNFIPVAFSIVFAFGFFVPVIVGCLMQKFIEEDSQNKERFGFAMMMSIYGYATFCYIPIILLCAIPITYVQWLFLIYATLNSSLFMVNNCQHELSREHLKTQKYMVCGFIIACQIVLLFTYKYTFFVEGDYVDDTTTTEFQTDYQTNLHSAMADTLSHSHITKHVEGLFNNSN